MNTSTPVSTSDAASRGAKVVAALRPLAHIPYAEQISRACKAPEILTEITYGSLSDLFWLAPLIEQRFEALRVLLEQSGIKNVVDLGSGFSPLGLMVSEDESCTFVETDLPRTLSEKSEILRHILTDRGTPRENLRCLSVDAVSPDSFGRISDCFGPGPVAVVTDGLLPYLSREGRVAVAANVRRLLRSRKGVWLTPDLLSGECFKQLVSIDPNVGEVMRAISGHADSKGLLDTFLLDDRAAAFFGGMGFGVKRHLQSQLAPRLASLDAVEVDPRMVGVIRRHCGIFALEMPR